MSLKSRVQKIENQSPVGGIEPDAIFVCSLSPIYDSEGNVIPRKSGDTEGRTPGFAFIVKGPNAGSQVVSEDGETMKDFKTRVERVVEGLE